MGYRETSSAHALAQTGNDACCIFAAWESQAPQRRCAYGSAIARGSTIDHDGDNSHKALADILCLKKENCTTKETRNLSDDDNPMKPINAVHRSLKRFMRQHLAYDRDSLQDWLNLFWFIYTKRSIPMDDKVKKFLQIAILTHKVVRFREVFTKKADK